MNLHAIGIDLGKTTFHLVGLNQAGEVQVRKKFSRSQLLRFTANVQVHLIGMEACAGSHFLGKALREQGHTARLMPAQYVKPFVKTNKSDFIDAEAIAEAVSRPSMRFVPIKTDEQLDMQSLHRVRERWIMRRTSVVNQIRGLLLERGITVRTGRCHLDAALPGILEDGSTSLSGTVRFLLLELKQELEQLAGHIEQAETLIERAAQQSEACQRLDAIPGIGPLTATALIAAIGNGGAFRKGREFAAWVGLVPREHSTGGKQKLLGISKRGNSYLRKLFVQGARAVLEIQRQAVLRFEALASRAVIAQPLQHRRRGTGQQTGTHGMGRTGQRRCLSASGSGWHDWSADDGCLTTALEIALRFPHPQTSYGYCNKVKISRQVCWRTMRWHNGRTRRSPNPNSEEVLRDCVTNGERSAAHSILARSLGSNKGRIHLRRPTCHSHFSLAARRRTIHAE